jgi:hypothetical protein
MSQLFSFPMIVIHLKQFRNPHDLPRLVVVWWDSSASEPGLVKILFLRLLLARVEITKKALPTSASARPLRA